MLVEDAAPARVGRKHVDVVGGGLEEARHRVLKARGRVRLVGIGELVGWKGKTKGGQR